MYTLKYHVRGAVNFSHYFDGNLWYETSTTNFLFPVPISDIGNAKFIATDRAMLFMRYIRKHLELSNEKA